MTDGGDRVSVLVKMMAGRWESTTSHGGIADKWPGVADVSWTPAEMRDHVVGSRGGAEGWLWNSHQGRFHNTYTTRH